uniref:Endoribonuclease n=1 Tax=Romanomermis culicivorax TaxID=13658 RepID=A0A915JL76_ROMCU
MSLFSYFPSAVILTFLSVQFNLTAQFKKQGKISADELQDVVTILWYADADRRNLTLNYQAKLDRDNVDKSDDKLFPVDTLTKFNHKSTIQKLLKIYELYDNQVGDLDQNLLRSRTEEFLNEIMATKELTILQQKLKQYGVRSAGTLDGFKNLIDEIWFKRYKRKKAGKLGSSAFQHVFVGEVDHRKETVSGMHNWIRFFVLEQKNLIDYAGFVNGGSQIATSAIFNTSLLYSISDQIRYRRIFAIKDTQRPSNTVSKEIGNPSDLCSKSNKRPSRSINDGENPIATIYPEVGKVADKCNFKKIPRLEDISTSKGNFSAVNLDKTSDTI